MSTAAITPLVDLALELRPGLAEAMAQSLVTEALDVSACMVLDIEWAADRQRLYPEALRSAHSRHVGVSYELRLAPSWSPPTTRHRLSRACIVSGWSRDYPDDDGARLLDDIEVFLARFVAFPSESARVAVTLFAAHTHTVLSFDSSPRLALLSPEPSSGRRGHWRFLSCWSRAPCWS